MIDLDKLFSDYVTEYVHENIGKKKPDVIEAEIPELYDRWLNTVHPVLNATPLGFVNNLKAEGKLCAYAEELIKSGVEISDVLGDAFGEAEEDGLIALYHSYPEYRYSILGIIKNAGAMHAETEAFLVETALTSEDEGLSEMAAEALFEGHEGVVEPILDRLSALTDERKLLAFDVLYRYPGHERTLWALLDGLKTGDNVPLFCEYIASFGDDRAVGELIGFAKRTPMTKIEFREIRNAVEALGGDMPEYNYEING